jgi:hypothetical protein
VSTIFRLVSFQDHLESTINFTGCLLRLPGQESGAANHLAHSEYGWVWAAPTSSMFVNSQLPSKPGYQQRIFRLGSLSECLFRMHLPMSCCAIPYFALPTSLGTVPNGFWSMMLLDLSEKMNAVLVDPLKTTIVQDYRCMTTWVLRKRPKLSNSELYWLVYRDGSGGIGSGSPSLQRHHSERISRTRTTSDGAVRETRA